MTDPEPMNAGDGLVEAADYLIDNYRRLWRGGVVRDLAEAEGAYPRAKDLTALAQSQHPGWRPISEAPTDGREYLAGRYDDGLWTCGVLRGFRGYPFTHFMPLPSPPSQEKVA